MKKKILIAVAAFAAVFVLAVAILFFVVDADSFGGYIETRVEEVLGRDVRLGSIRLSFLPVFGLTVDDVAVAARPGEGEGDLLSMRSLRIGARLKPLLQKRLEVTSIVLVEPAVNLVRDANGNWNFDLGGGDDDISEGGEEADAGPVADVTIDAIQIRGGRLSVTDASRSQAQPLEVALTDLDLEVSDFGGEDVRIAVARGMIDVGDAALGPDPVHLEVGTIDLAVRGGGDTVELEHFELVVGKTAVVLSGTVKALPDGHQIDIDLQPTDIDVSDLSSLLEKAAGDTGMSLSGRRPVGIEAGVHGALSEGRLPEITGRATLDGLTFKSESLTQDITDLAAVATLRGTTVALEGLRAKVGGSDFSGTLRIAAAERPTLDFNIESQRADLGELLGLVAGGEPGETANQSPPDPDSFVMRGVANGTLEVAEGSWDTLRFRNLEARVRLENGVATLEPVSMELYDGRFNGRLASDLARVPQSFEFSGEAENIDMNPFVADQMGMNEVLFGRFTGRIAGSGAGADPTSMIRSLEGEGTARINDGQVGKLDVLRSVGQVAGVLGQRTLANLASESATGATEFSQLAGNFQISGGTLNLESVLLESESFDLTGTGTVDMLSSVMNGAFQLQFSPEVSGWMKEESSRAAELFWDAASGRVVLPLGLSGPLDGTGASVDWGAAAEGVARRTIERELDNVLGNLLGGSRDDKPAEDAAVSSEDRSSAAEQAPADVPVELRRAEAPSGQFAIAITRSRWGGSFLAQDFKISCGVTGTGVERVVMTAVDAGGNQIQQKTIDLTARIADGGDPSFETRVDGKKLVLASYPVTVKLVVSATDGETAELVLVIEAAGR